MIIANYIVHYGSDYLGYSVKSIYDQVDEIFVAYTDQPSHGHGTNLKNPDSKDDVRNALFAFGDPKNKIKWHEGRYHNEGQHRDQIYKIYPTANLIVVADTDEIWNENTLTKSIEFALKQNVRTVRMSFIHFWRSFKYYVQDECMPDRFYLPGKPDGFAYVPKEFGPVLHFGYAREERFIKYKIDIHGHKGEWRQDWFEGKFKAWPNNRQMSDLHPTCHRDFWKTPKEYDINTLPPVLKQHPYFTRDII